MKYKVVNSSGSTEKILEHTEVPPVLRVIDGKYYDFEGTEYTMVPDQVKVPEQEVFGGLGIIAIVALIIGIAVFSLTRKK